MIGDLDGYVVFKDKTLHACVVIVMRLISRNILFIIFMVMFFILFC